jgi:hypothetical protein
MTSPAPEQIPAARVIALPSAASAAVQLTALPATVNLSLYAGDDFTMRVDVTDADGEPFDLTGWLPESQIRARARSETIAGEFVATLDESAIILHLTPQVSAGLPSRCVWDVQISRDEEHEVITLAAGTISMTAQVTR